MIINLGEEHNVHLGNLRNFCCKRLINGMNNAIPIIKPIRMQKTAIIWVYPLNTDSETIDWAMVEMADPIVMFHNSNTAAAAIKPWISLAMRKGKYLRLVEFSMLMI